MFVLPYFSLKIKSDVLCTVYFFWEISAKAEDEPAL
jgi:hypothetical protein